MTITKHALAVLAISLLAAAASAAGEKDSNWPRWRGTQNNGSVEGGQYPAKWDADKVLWKARLPGIGCSTPIVWDHHIYVTSPAGDQDAVLAFDWNGQKVWQVELGVQNPGKHRNASGSNSSPATDGKGLYVYFKSGTLAALELNGDVRWSTNLVERFGPATLFWDHGTSPVLTRRDVIMTRMHKGESWVAAFDKQTGEMRWKVARNYETPVEGDHGYTTPVVIQHNGKEALLLWGAQHITVHDPSNGKVLWSCGGFNPEDNRLWPAIATPVIVDDIAVVSFGRNDRGDPRLHGIKLGGSGDVTKSHRVWKRNDTGTFVPSPAEYKGRVYLVRDGGQIECLDPTTGKTLWLHELPKNRSAFYASPVIAGGKLYAIRIDGVVFVGDIEDKFKLLGENDMKERVIASAVPCDNRLFIRGDHHLFCIVDPEL